MVKLPKLLYLLAFIASYYQFGILYTFIISTFYLLYLCEIFNTLDTTLKTMYNRYKGVKALVSLSGQYKNIFIGTMTLILHTIWHAFLCYMNNTITKKDNKNIITIACGGKLYKIIVKNMRTPDEILEVIDQDSNDVTNEVIPFLRFQKILCDLTPADLGYKELEIITTENNIEVKENDIISF